MNKNRKIVILGVNGQLGSEFHKRLKGVPVSRNIDVLDADGDILWVFNKDILDITNFENVRKEIRGIKPDVIINCAAYNDVDKAEVEWRNAFIVNGYAVKNLAELCKEIGCVLVHYSSDYVFGGSDNLLEKYTIVNNPKPLNKYGTSKLLGEHFVKESGCKYYLIRTSWLFGMNENVSFPLKLIKWATGKKELRVVDDQVSSPTYVADLVEATLSLIDTEEYGLYHITNTGWCSRYEWAKYILKIVGWKGTVEPAKGMDFNTPATRPMFSVLDNFPLLEIADISMPDWQNATDRFIKDNEIKI
uniref:Putative dTDP-4-dehydrorhamnose reductase n=1 Tax=viral metagenome TaxID=1070528 RepID=A0A6M3M601_9ZZZZ